jgi:hypothetical protein
MQKSFMNHSVIDLEHFNCLKLTERQQFFDALVDDWEVPRDLASCLVEKLATVEKARDDAERRVADLEYQIESQNSCE